MSQTNQVKRRTKSSESLVTLFWEKTNNKPISLAVSLMGNLAKLANYVLYNVKTEQMNFLSKLYDKTQLVFI